MTKEDVDLIKFILKLPKTEQIRQHFGLKDEVELVAFMGLVVSAIAQMDVDGKLPNSQKFRDMAKRTQATVVLMRGTMQLSPKPVSDLDVN
jgi:hypothetical protein